MRRRTTERSLGRPKRRGGPIALVLLTLVAILLAAVMLRDGRIQTAIAHRPAAAAPLTYGVLGSTCDADRARALQQAGVKVAQLDIEWQRFEPEPGQYSPDYVSELNTNVGICRAAGLTVSVGLGLPYAPGWVADLPDGRYINQFGDGFAGRVPNIVFSHDVRASFATYLAKLFEVLDTTYISSIRIGTGTAGELGYPYSHDSGNSFWAYNDAAQTGEGLPTDVQPTPFPGWTPGSDEWRGSTVTKELVAQWFSWYSRSVAEADVWQTKLLRTLGFTGQIYLPLAGRGALPADLDLALAAGLDGTADRDGSLQGGLNYPDQLAYIASEVGTAKISADVTGLDDPTAVDARKLLSRLDMCRESDVRIDLSTVRDAERWSSARWTIAAARQAGFDVVGENPGSPDAPGTGGHAGSDDLRTQMQFAPRYARDCGLSAFFWAFEDDLFGDPADLTLADYVKAINESK